MRRSPITIGVLAAELAVGALVLAPPAAADDEVAVDTDPEVPAVPLPVEAPSVSVRTGRTGDPHALTPVASPDEPQPGPAPDEPTAPSAPAPEPTEPPDGPAPSAEPPGPASSAPPIPVPSTPSSPSSGPVPAAPVPAAHTVVEGDNLWHIAAQHLAAVTGRDRAALPVAEVAAYWVRVCDANRSSLRSGNLDLIYAGEVVTLPVL